MGVIVGVIKYLILVATIGTMFYARGLYLELKATRDKLQKAQEAIEDLKEELQKSRNRNEMNNTDENIKRYETRRDANVW